jgi:protein-disulfide isomerase
VIALVGVLAAAAIGAGAWLVSRSSNKRSSKVSLVTSDHSAVMSVLRILHGVPQSFSALGDVAGDPRAPVTMIEFADLVSSVCRSFALGPERQMIANDVRDGKVRLVYRGFDSVSVQANSSEYVTMQVAALSAGLQHRGWEYILLMYEEQPVVIGGANAETVPYVTSAYLQHIAKQIPGLNLFKWQKDLYDPQLIGRVAAAEAAGTAAGVIVTPTLRALGPRGTSDVYVSNSNPVPTFAALQAAIAAVR